MKTQPKIDKRKYFQQIRKKKRVRIKTEIHIMLFSRNYLKLGNKVYPHDVWLNFTPGDTRDMSNLEREMWERWGKCLSDFSRFYQRVYEENKRT